MATLSGNQLHIRETNPPFRNKSQLLLPLTEEIVNSPEKLDLLSSSIKGKQIRPKKVRILNLKRAIAFNSRSTREKLTLPSEGRQITPVVFVFVLQVAVILLSIGECHDYPLTLKIQDTTIPWSTFEPNLSTNGKVIDIAPNFGSMVTFAVKKLTFCKKKLVPLFINSKRENLECLVGLVKEGKLKTVIDSIYPLRKVEDGWAKSIHGQATGKIIFEP